MRRAVYLFLILMSCSQTNSLTIPVEVFLYPIPFNGKYGYVDKNLDLVVKPIFKKAFTFQEGYGRVQFDEKTWGFIDKNGTIIVKLNCIYLDNFNSGIAMFTKDDKKKGFITNQGKIIIENLRNALSFTNGIGYGLFSDGWKFIDQSGNVLFHGQAFESITPFSDDLAFVESEGEFYFKFIDKNGKTVLNSKFTASGSQFSEGLAFVQISDKKGYINKKGEFVIRDDEIAHAYPFYHGVALIAKGFLPDFVYDLIDTEGNYITEFISGINFATPFVEGFSIVSSDDKGAGYLDTHGQFLIDLQFDTLDHFHGPYGIGYINGKQEAFIDRNGSIYRVKDIIDKIMM
ncbi:MAG: WG repeat-containing protein [Spirochaetales bacterium]|nr:WG repeat-containing protein [Spirochaetales bacterium]